MSFFQALIQGIVQGLTEFLPVSSSAHLVIVPYLLNWDLDPEKAFIFNVLVQLGTLVAVIIYFWKDLVSIVTTTLQGLKEKQAFATSERRLGWYIILGTIPAGLAGLILKSKVEETFSSPTLTAVLLFVTAILLSLAEILSKKEKELDQLTWLDSLVIGIFQALAIFPGISRSGATVAGGLFKGYTRETAARFSFLLSVPIMLAAGLLSILGWSKLISLWIFTNDDLRLRHRRDHWLSFNSLVIRVSEKEFAFWLRSLLRLTFDRDRLRGSFSLRLTRYEPDRPRSLFEC